MDKPFGQRLLYQRAHELIFFLDAKLFHSGSNSGTPWHLKKGLAHALVGIRGLGLREHAGLERAAAGLDIAKDEVRISGPNNW